jgi:hypothetical protein
MAVKDLREWIDDLEERNDLKRVKAEVDWDEEIGAITREISSQFGPALLFENIKGHKNTLCRRLFTNGTGTKERVCRILGVSEKSTYRELVAIFKERFSKPLKPVTVSSGPVKENIVKKDAVDLFQFPVPKWNPHDGGRYIMTSASIVSRDPDNGILNAGTYRGMIAQKITIGVLLAMTQGWGKHFSKYINRGQEMPVAVVIGWDQALFMTASTPVNHPEYELAGSLRGAPVELVKCETSDLMVPASAEIVLEGFVSADPKTFEPEGPFSEYPGYYAGRKTPKHAIRVEHHPPQRSDFSWLSHRLKPGANQRGNDLDARYVLGNGLAIFGRGRGAERHRGLARQVARTPARADPQEPSRPRPAGGQRALGLPPRQLRGEASDRRRRRHRYSRLGSDRVGALLSDQRRAGRHHDVPWHLGLDARSQRAVGGERFGQVRPRQVDPGLA